MPDRLTAAESGLIVTSLMALLASLAALLFI